MPLDRFIGQPNSRGNKVVKLETNSDRVPPHSNDAEVAVLGAMMLGKEASTKVIPILSPDSFYRESHRVIYQAMVALADRNQPVAVSYTHLTLPTSDLV